MKKPPHPTGGNFDLELQRARKRFARTRCEVRQMVQQAREISEASRKRVMASMTMAA